jgi:hypothetical protein
VEKNSERIDDGGGVRVESINGVPVNELSLLKAQYDAASQAYREITTRNARQALTGLRPSDRDFQLEDNAQEQLATARRAYLASLRVDAKH